MSDVSKAIAPKSDQLNADDLLTGDKVIKITDVKVKDSVEQPITVNFEGDSGKPYKPCKSMSRVMAKIWGEDSKAWVGHSLQLFCDPNVTWAGVKVGGIRISHMTGINKPVTIALTASKAKRAPFTVKPLGDIKTTEMPEDEFQNIISSIESAEDKSTLTALNIAQYKDKLSSDQATKMRDAYKSKISTLKEEEIPV